jgi:ATP-dependent helicase HrpA
MTASARFSSFDSSFGQLAGPPPATTRAANPLAAELLALVPPRFPERVPFDRLPHLPRYLKALLTRAERAVLNPQKDRDRAAQLAPYIEALRKLREQALPSLTARRELDAFVWLVEEFKVSLFAQELGTSIPVSPQRLEQQLQRVRVAGE